MKISYKVVCDSTNNSAKDLESGRVNVGIYMWHSPIVIEMPLNCPPETMPDSNSVYPTES